MTKLGVNHPNRKAFETALKKPLDAGVRCYNLADARSAHADGYKVTFSYKPTGTFAQAAANDASSDRAIAQEIASWGPGNVLAKQHEPENDGQSAASFVAMQTSFRNAVESILHAAGCRWGICLMGQTFKDNAQDQWIGTLKPDTVTADAYLWRGATSVYAPSEKQASYGAFTAYLSYCTAKGYAPELWEFGCSRTQADTQGVHRSEELERFATAFKDRFAAIFYFESPPPKVDWEIRTEPRSMAAVASMAAVVVPPPGETDAQKIARLTAELAAMTAQRDALQVTVGSLTAERDTLNDQLLAAQESLRVETAKVNSLQDTLLQIHNLSASV